MTTEAWAKIVVTLVAALIAYWGARHSRENKRLKRQLRRALLDNLSFHGLEELYCQCLLELGDPWKELPPVTDITPSRIMSLKRAVRARFRLDAGRSPSDDATPAKLNQEIEKLTL